jgi:ABC-type Fe3+ transport system permease subunit
VPGDWSAPGYSPPRRNGAAVAGLVAGLVALPLALLVVPGVVLGILAIVLGVVGRRRVARHEATAKGLATTSVVLGSVAVAGAVALLVVAGVLGSRAQDRYERCLESGETQSVCVDRHDPPKP